MVARTRIEPAVYAPVEDGLQKVIASLKAVAVADSSDIGPTEAVQERLQRPPAQDYDRRKEQAKRRHQRTDDEQERRHRMTVQKRPRDPPTQDRDDDQPDDGEGRLATEPHVAGHGSYAPGYGKLRHGLAPARHKRPIVK